MALELRSFQVEDAQLADGPTRLVGRTLLIGRDEVGEMLSHVNLERVELELVRPGDDVRIVNVLDMVQPIYAEEKAVFPGFLGDAHTVGWGATARLEGFRVVSCGGFPRPQSSSLTTKDGLIDMAGPGAEQCLGSDTVNLVAVYFPASDVTNEGFDSCVRELTLRLARNLAAATVSHEPDETICYDLSVTHDELPGVVYVNQLQDQGSLIRAYLYGMPLGEDFVPTLIDPLEMMDGAVVSGNYRNCMKKPTSLHTRDPVIEELCQAHSRDLNFKGVILCRGHHADEHMKLRSASYVAKLATLVGAEGVVLAIEGTGNGTVDFFLTLECCEKAGIPSVGMVHELGGSRGEDSALVYDSTFADALVSTGGVERELDLPRVGRVIGGSWFLNYSQEPQDANLGFKARALDLYGSFWKMSTAGFTCVEG